MPKHLTALAICIAIGAACARFGIPLPAPVDWFGVALIAAIYAGYAICGRL